MDVGSFNSFLKEVADGERTAGRVADSLARHLANCSVGDLPPAAAPDWREVARLLKSSGDKPIPVKAISAIRSWPSARVAELIGHIRHIQTLLDQRENERLEDEIRDRIRRHYL